MPNFSANQYSAPDEINQSIKTNRITPTRFIAVTFCILTFIISNISHAQSVDEQELARQLREGEFVKYPPEYLEKLGEVIGQFDQPGKSIPYLTCFNHIETNLIKGGLVEEFNAYIDHPQITAKQKSFMRKTISRLLNLTPKEKSGICACNTDDTWNNLMTSEHRTAYNKMAQGIPLTEKDNKALQKKTNVVRPATEYDPMACIFKPMDLYREYRSIF
ncbi:hypothetical protein [Kiloniella sp.]|uniref:hypothetical protein n=1 Tax=Kiloniella sp. TaxID=1938587 RepID=UPI003A8D33F2